MWKTAWLAGICLAIGIQAGQAQSSPVNDSPPASAVKLIFIHHSTGENWLADDNGGLGISLRDNNYFVSDTNYGWGPDGIGDSTDLGQWWLWFRGPSSPRHMTAVYSESEQHSSYTRLGQDPGGENQIVMFKSCFPNSALRGNPEAGPPSIDSNQLKGEDSGSSAMTVANAKGIYIDILEYFREHPEKLFIAITAPPLSDDTYAANARAFNQWLVNDWLADYPLHNVFVFDFFNALTSNGGRPGRNDLGSSEGNHHRVYNGAEQHQVASASNTLAYPSDDDHPNSAGGQKASAEYLPLLNMAYNRWQGSAPPVNSVVLSSSRRKTKVRKLINLSASAHGFDFAEYSFRYRKRGAAAWKVLSDFSGENAVSWRSRRAGIFEFMVYAREAGDSETETASALVSVRVRKRTA